MTGTMNAIVCFISGQEIFIIFVVVLLLFGAKKIPEIARGLGKGMREFRKATEDIKREINEQSEDISKDIDEFKNTLNK